MSSVINATTTSGLQIQPDNSGSLQLKTNNGTTAVTIDTSQNVGIGTASPGQKLSINSANTSTNSLVEFKQGDVVQGYVGFGQDNILRLNSAAAQAAGILVTGAGYAFIGTNNAERMRIDSSGNVLVGTTTNNGPGKIALDFDSAANFGLSIRSTNVSNNGVYSRFYNSSNAQAGQIVQTAATTVSYTTSSDYRLKENVQPMVGALDKVLQLNPVTYTWKQDGADGQGFIAHELQAVVPDCVVGKKDAVNEDGSIDPQGIDTSFLVATLTAAIQEQQTIINDLKARIETLEAK